MTDTDGPFDTKPWSEAQWARHAAAWAPSGVYGPPAASTTTGDLPLSVSGLSVGLGAGRAWVRGFGFERTGAAVMQAVTANTHASFSRRDRIVLRRNLATHAVTPVLIQGTPASSPVAPDLTQTESGSWDLPLFSFLVPPNSGTTLTSSIDERRWLLPDGSAAALHGVELFSNLSTPVGSGVPSGLAFPTGTASYDSDGYFTGPNSLSILTIPAGLGGLYRVCHRVQLSSVVPGRFFADANAVSGGNKVSRANGTGDDIAQSSRPMRLAAGDVFNLNAYHEASGTLNVVSRSLSLHLIGT